MAPQAYTKDGSFVVPIWINNQEYKTSANHPKFDVTKPPNHEKVWSAQASTPELGGIAIKTASQALKQWSRSPISQRKEIFTKAADLLEERNDEAIYYMEQEIGAEQGWAGFNKFFCVNALRNMADTMEGNLETEEVDTKDGTIADIYKVPYGVILAIAPWNAPLILGLRSILAPLACGNTVIMLSSSMSPMCHQFLAKLLADAGLPSGVLSVLPSNPGPKEAAQVVEELLKNPAVKKANFTGSTNVGWKINEVAGRYGKPTLMELGGKCATIALEDADIDKLAGGLIHGAFENAGQICMSTEVAIIPKSISSQLLPKLKTQVQEVHQKPLPLITNAAIEKLQKLLEDAQSKGAKLLVGSIPDASVKTSGMMPVIVTDITEDMDIYQTETFGPIFTIVEYDGKNVEEAINITKSLGYGLSVSVYSEDIKKAQEVAMEVESGAIHINHRTVHDNPALPHGGVKGSGFGRFGGKWGLAEFTVIKTITRPN